MSHSEGYLLGIDLGTTTVRGLLFDLQGRPVAEAYREPPLHHPRPDWAELDADDWWHSCVAVIREVLGCLPGAAAHIRGVGLSGLLHALIPVDEHGDPLERAMLWMDQRCAPQAAWMERHHRETLSTIMGPQPVSTTWSAPKLRWLVENRPQMVAATFCFLSVKDYVRYRLTGHMGAEPSDAGGTYLFDQRQQNWSGPLLKIVGIRPDQLPPLYPSAQVAGGILPEAAEITGLLPGTPVVFGGGDTRCTRLGAGVEATDRSCIYLGTAAWVSVPQPRQMAFGATATTGATLKWLARLWGTESRTSPAAAYQHLLDGVDQVEPGAQGLLFLPHLMGERGPVPNPGARGVFFGLTLAHGRRELARAVLEGCAFHLRTIVEGLGELPPGGTVVTGGGAKSPLWLQILADVLGIPLRVPAVTESASLGAAMLAAVGIGLFPDPTAAMHRWVDLSRRVEPQPQARAEYRRIYHRYLALERQITPLYGAEMGEEA